MTDDATYRRAVDRGNALEREKDAALAECERLRADAERLDYLQNTGSTVSILPRHERLGRMNWTFQVGGLFAAVNSDIRAAIDAARKVKP